MVKVFHVSKEGLY